MLNGSGSLRYRLEPTGVQDKKDVFEIEVESTRFHVGRDAFKKASKNFAEIAHAFVQREYGSFQKHAIKLLSPADPATFRHIVDFIEYGRGPLFYQQDQGFDYARYAALQVMCIDFGVDALALWISNRQYERAVEVTRSFHEISVRDLTEGRHRTPFDTIEGVLQQAVGWVGSGMVLVSSKTINIRCEALRVDPVVAATSSSMPLRHQASTGSTAPPPYQEKANSG